MSNFFASIYNTIIAFGGNMIIWMIILACQIMMMPFVVIAYAMEGVDMIRTYFRKRKTGI